MEVKEDTWLNSHLMSCPNCKEELQICDHSPFESSYVLYCDSCPKRVDVSVYEKPINNQTFDDIKIYEEKMLFIEQRLQPCDCGGHFRLTAKRRCLHCEEPLDLNEAQNIWLKGYWDDFETDEEEELMELKMQKFIVPPKWKMD